MEEVQYLRNLLRFHTDTSGDQLPLAAAAAYEVGLHTGTDVWLNEFVYFKFG